MTDADPFAGFAAYGEARAPKERKPRERKPVLQDADAPMMPTPMEKQMREVSAQMGRYRRAKRAERAELREVLPEFGELAKLVRGLPGSSKALVAFVNRGDWVAKLNRGQRMVVIGMIDDRIQLKRMMDGRPPMDDPIFDQPDNLFLICRKAVMGH